MSTTWGIRDVAAEISDETTLLGSNGPATGDDKGYVWKTIKRQMNRENSMFDVLVPVQDTVIELIDTSIVTLDKVLLGINIQLEKIIANSVTEITGNATFFPGDGSSLDEISLNAVTTIGGNLTIGGSPSLLTVGFDDLVTIDGMLVVQTSSSIANLSFPSLESVGQFYIDLYTLPALTTFSIPVLSNTAGIRIRVCPLLVINFPSLITVTTKSIDIEDVANTSMSFPSLTSTISFFRITNATSLTTLDMSTVTHPTPVGTDIQVMVSSNPLLTTLTLGANLTNLKMCYFGGNALPQAKIDEILAKLDANGITGGTVSLSGGANATPSAAGLTSKSNLVGKGWTVTNN